MNRSINLLILAVILILLGCAQRGGHNPIGVTGGSDDGYGKSKDLNQTSSSSYEYATLIGSWRYDESMTEYSLWIFYTNGDFTMKFYEDGSLEFTIEGTYSTSNNTLTIYLDGEPYYFTYSIYGNQFILSGDGESIVLKRV